ncbi:hypothetical protein DRQ32_08050, partial [bacterium]
MKKVSTLLFLALMLSMAQGASLLKSDFSGSDGWKQEYGGTWQIENGTCRGKTRSIWSGDKSWENYSFSCRARCLEDGDEGQIWLSFRYADEWNRYTIAIRGGQLDEVALFRYRDEGYETPSVMCPLNIPLGFDFKGNQWYDVKVEVVDGTIKVWVGDTDRPQIDYEDASPIPHGAIALGGNYHLCEFDDALVNALESIETGDEVVFSDSAIKVNFGPKHLKIDGFKNSDGSEYSSKRGFGWDKNITGSLRQRSLASSEKLNTLITVAHKETTATFSVDLPNGEYYVTAVAGDPLYPGYFSAYLQDDIFLKGRMIGAGESHHAAEYARVTDGKLRLRLNRPVGEAGLSLAYLVIEKWNKVSDLRKNQQKTEKELALEKEQKRIHQRQEYRPVVVEGIDKNSRTEISLNGNWLFMPEQDLADGSRPESPESDDLNWHIMNVPDFWNQITLWTQENGPFGLRGQDMFFRYDEIFRTREFTFDYGATKSAWYRQWIDIPESAQGRRMIVKFNASASVSTIYINGHRLGDHVGMFTPFEFDITDHIKWGEENLLAAHVSSGARKQTGSSDKVAGVAVSMAVTDDMLNSLPKGMIKSIATTTDFSYTSLPRANGIWQPVTLYMTSPVVIKDVFFKPNLRGAEIEVTVENPTQLGFSGEIGTYVAGKKELKKIFVKKNSSKTFTVTTKVNNPKLWTPETPNLYKLKVVLVKNGKQIEKYSCSVGFRTFTAKEGRFYLNGRPRWMGGANHPPHGLRPNDEKLANEFLKLMHDGNQMVTRSHASPFTPTWADAADKQGVAVSLEGTWPWVALYGAPMPTGVLLEAWFNETLDLVKQLRNHPSIVIWTLGNEFCYDPRYHQDEDDPEGGYLEKMKILDELIGRIREIDPTRPICIWSNYTREPHIYEPILEPNGIDDGDITDPHRYCGWYGRSVFHDANHNGGYLTGNLGQACMSQEASTGYPNNDNGSPQRIYIQMYVPQSWIGDEAYEHRDPATFLEYHALISKEWMEDVRRTRRTAGWQAFSNVCWFKNVTLAGHIEPYPVYYEMKKALQPVLVSLDQRDRHCYQGNEFSGKIVVVNDDVDGKDVKGLSCTIRIKNADGKTVFETHEKIDDCTYYSNRTKDFSFVVPHGITPSRMDCKLEMTLKSG